MVSLLVKVLIMQFLEEDPSLCDSIEQQGINLMELLGSTAPEAKIPAGEH